MTRRWSKYGLARSVLDSGSAGTAGIVLAGLELYGTGRDGIVLADSILARAVLVGIER